MTRKPSRPGTPITAVGWNCRNSRSASCAPALWASSIPLPSDPGGFVVRAQSAAAPPAQTTTARARTARPSVARRARRSGRPRRAACRPAHARATSISGSCAASAESWRTTRRPVALPPECTTRRSEWPPSSPSESAPPRSTSKCTPRRSRSCTRAGRLGAEHRGGRARAPGRARRARCRRGGAAGCRRPASAAASPPWAQ